MNRSFECIEKIAVHMADNCFSPVAFPNRLQKLEEEFAELMEQLNSAEFNQKLDSDGTMTTLKAMFPESPTLTRVKDEMGDVLFILLHMSNALGFTGSDLIHHAASKMLKRMKDANYKPKI